MQGVGLRWHISRCAEECLVKGAVQNMPDATVQTIAYGNKDQLIKFIDHCKIGSRFSRIDNVTISWEETTDAPDHFKIL